MSRFGLHAVAALMTFTASATAHAAEGGIDGEPQTSATVTALYYAMRDQPDFGVGVASLNRGSLRFEARYNYEARDAASAFVGWKFAGGDAITYEVTPIVGVLFGAAKGVIPGVEASIAYRTFDAYVEAEYVSDLQHHADSYFYAWIELGWRPVEWLRVGLVGSAHPRGRGRPGHPARDLRPAHVS